MSELRADALSPIDAATLWPQMNRLATEVVATRSADNLLVTSGLAATGLTRLPRVPRTIVMGVRPGLKYRGVLVARQLDGGVAWEIDSLRIARDTDSEAVTSLLNGVGDEVTRRGGRTLFLRHEEGSPHARAIQRGGFRAYVSEQLYALPPSSRRAPHATAFREMDEADEAPLFRLYCRAVPESVRRHEAPIEENWRAVRDSHACEQEFVLDGEGTLVAWAGIGEREARVLSLAGDGRTLAEAFSLVQAVLGRQGALVAAEFQEGVARAAVEAGYTPLGVRVVCSRTLAVTQTITERAAVAEAPRLTQ